MSEAQTNATPIVLDPMRVAFAPDATVLQLGRTHFIGIGGAGMSVLAEMLHERGVDVDGSDREEGSKTERLRSLGITVEIGQQADNVRGADTVVYSSAIKPDNPEIVAAHERGIRIVHRSDILALLMNGRRAVTVAGAHGKTTTSSLLSHILVHAGTGKLADPSYAIGGTIQAPGGAVLDGGHAGRGDVLVAEADESDGSFCKYRPSIAVITNALADHLDHYGDEAHYCAAFVDHAGHASGHVVMTGDDEGAVAVLRDLDPSVARRTIVYATKDADQIGDMRGATLVRIDAEHESADSGRETFTVHVPASLASVCGCGDADLALPVSLAIPGMHNARNATAAILAAMLLGVTPGAAAQTASTFLGASRRFQVRGEENGVTVVDDYAHHPTEIAATLHAAANYPHKTLWCVFQPHTYTRTKAFMKDFAKALSLADKVVLADIYAARETDTLGISSETLQAEIQALGHECYYFPSFDEIENFLLENCINGDLLITMGAGDVVKIGENLLGK